MGIMIWFAVVSALLGLVFLVLMGCAVCYELACSDGLLFLRGSALHWRIVQLHIGRRVGLDSPG